MKDIFIYGKAVEGENFTDREEEAARLKMNFESGMNVILISPRRMGKTSLVKKVCAQITNPKIKTVLLDVYDCRNEYEFYNRFVGAILKATATKSEQIIDDIKKFMIRLSPKISFSANPDSDISLSLGITPQNYSPEEILNLPEEIATEKGIHIVVCIDEFQQVGEFENTLTIQKRMRGIWQHQKNVSYCLFGSKKHFMTNLVQNKQMPFYQFGEINELPLIATEKWVPFIMQKFSNKGMNISAEYAEKICQAVGNHSSYVQQLAWNIMVATEKEVDESTFESGMKDLFAQCTSYFQEQIRALTSYQMNFIRLLCMGVKSGFGTKENNEIFPLGSKSNIVRVKTTLIEKEIIDIDKKGNVKLSDYVFEQWFRNNYM